MIGINILKLMSDYLAPQLKSSIDGEKLFTFRQIIIMIGMVEIWHLGFIITL